MKKPNLIQILTLILLIFTSCTDDDPSPIPVGAYENGYFVTNEGPFQTGSGSLTFVHNEGAVSQNVYKSVNGEDLGNIVNSMYFAGDRAYIVVNNSHKIVVANRFTMEKIGVIQGDAIKNPRYFVAIDNLGYISNWGDPFDPSDDFVAVVDLQTNEVMDKVAVGEGPEKMIADDTDLYVCLQGGYGSNNQVVVIDSKQNSIRASIEVGEVPNSIIADNTGDLWVLCGGSPAWTGNETGGSLYQIDASDFGTTRIDFSLSDHPSLLKHDQGKLYYNLNGKVYQMGVDASEPPLDALPGLDGFYYTMEVKNGELFGADAGDFASEGTLKVFNINSGALLETIATGIVPGNIVFP